MDSERIGIMFYHYIEKGGDVLWKKVLRKRIKESSWYLE